MANPLGLLLLGVAGCWLIGRINRSTKVALVCMLSLALGFVAGGMTKLLSSVEKNETAIIQIDNTTNGMNTPMLCLEPTSLVWKSTNEYTTIAGKEYAFSDELCNITSASETVHPVRCLSPPTPIYDSG